MEASNDSADRISTRHGQFQEKEMTKLNNDLSKKLSTENDKVQSWVEIGAQNVDMIDISQSWKDFCELLPSYALKSIPREARKAYPFGTMIWISSTRILQTGPISRCKSEQVNCWYLNQANLVNDAGLILSKKNFTKSFRKAFNWCINLANHPKQEDCGCQRACPSIS